MAVHVCAGGEIRMHTHTHTCTELHTRPGQMDTIRVAYFRITVHDNNIQIQYQSGKRLQELR